MKMKSIVIAIYILGLYFSVCSAEFEKFKEFNQIEYEQSLISNWLIEQSNLMEHLNITNLNLRDIVLSKANTNNDQEEDHPCEQKTSMVLKHLLDGTPLPPEYNDFYKFVIYSGTGLNDLGDYLSCKKMDIMKYFTFQINVSTGIQNISLPTGLCYFKECDLEYMNKAKSDIISLINKIKGLEIKDDAVTVVDPDSLNEDYKNRMWIGFLISASLLGILAIFPILQCIIKSVPRKRASIIFDAEEERKSRKSFLENSNYRKLGDKTKFDSFLDIFDVSKNVSKLFEIRNIDASHEALKVFDGVRCLSTFWVVAGHTFYYLMVAGFKNLTYTGVFSKTWKLCLIVAGLYAVDVFFFLSGFMLCLSLHRYLNQSINKVKIIIMAIINRYLRLLPLYFFIIILMTYINPYLGSGPTFYKSQTLNSACPNYWWHNLLYINNLFKYEKGISCSGHTWYLANDMQFFIMALLITIIFNKMSGVKNLIFGSMFIASNAYQIYEAYTMNYKFNDLNHPSRGQADFFDGYYIKPWNRVCPYILGIFFCELFMTTEVHLSCHKNLPTSQTSEKGWMERFNGFLMSSNLTCAIIFIFSLVFINYAVFITYFTNNYDIPDIWHALFLTFNKVIFVFGLACITHLTFIGKIAFIRDFLSFKLFSVIAKFTYGIYLTHFYVLNVFYFTFNYVLFFNFSDQIFMAIGFILISLVCSFIFTILLESPVVNATKILLLGGRGKHKE